MRALLDARHDGRREVPVVFSSNRRCRALAALLSSLCAVACADSAAERVGAIELLVEPDARSFGLSRGADGAVSASWITSLDGVYALHATKVLRADGEREPPIASGSDWFVNWADVPAFAVESDGDAWASFLVRSGSATYDYDAWIKRRAKDGEWSGAVVLHEHAGSGEHGFVSLVPLDAEGTLAVWLDGRDTVARGNEGSMQLRARVVTASGREPELLLDPRVCDCCPTSAVRLEDGSVLIAYRDRSEDETRDFSVVIWRAGVASEPRTLFEDGWKIAGCPVNGAALGARGATVGAAWFTLGRENRARVQVSLSTDGGAHFQFPRLVSKRDTDGLVTAAMDAAGVFWVCWLERESRDRAQWMLAPVTAEGVGAARAIADTTVGRAAGLARLAASDEGLVFAWLDGDDDPRLRVWSLPDSRQP